MLEPDPELPPVIPPVIVPIVQLKLLGIEAVRLSPGLFPLHIVAAFIEVTAGEGLTVTVMLYAAPAHVPVAAVGVMR